MIPPSCTAKTPKGERELFSKLRDDPDTAGWVVLHSLDIKKHHSKIEGELDMVVLVPRLGVLCIEVKGCDVSRQGGTWIYPYETSLEGPFKQVSKAMYSLQAYMVKRDCSLSGLLFFSAVVFTRADFDEQSPEWHPWQFINRRLFVRHPISENINNILERAHAHIKTKVGRNSWYDETDSRPTEGQIRRIVSLLRDDFEFPVSPRADLEQIEQTIRHFTEEQFDALDILLDNDRVVFKGPAGTGKTFLAMEAVRRAVLEGKNVLFICYNHLLGDWLKIEAARCLENPKLLECKTFHSLLLGITGEKPVGAVSRDYWEVDLPALTINHLLDEEKLRLLYDLLIVDEAQDLLQEDYLDVMDLLLKGGLANGNWAFFGDFERQAIYVAEGGKGVQQSLAGLSSRSPRHAKYSLRINCRNAGSIADTLVITSGLVPGYKRVLHELEEAEVDPLFYSASADQQRLLNEAINGLVGVYKPGEIMILSMRSDENSCAGTASHGVLSGRVAPIRQVQDAQTIAFSSIHAFKGLEAPAVIITDIENLDDERSRALLYVGMSRARVRLFMLMQESCRSSYNRILDSGIEVTKRK